MNSKSLGNVELELTNTIIDEIQAPADLAAFKLRNGTMELRVPAVSFSVQLDFHYRQVNPPNISGHGHAHVTGTANVDLDVLFMEQDGKMNLQIPNANIVLEELELTVTESNNSWFFFFILHIKTFPTICIGCTIS